MSSGMGCSPPVPGSPRSTTEWLGYAPEPSLQPYSGTALRCSRHHSLEAGALSSADYSPPKPLEEVVREKRAYRRELHTVNVGGARLAATAATTSTI